MVNFDEIRSVQRKERNISSLAELSPGFYKDIVVYIKQLMDAYDKGDKLANARTLENTIKISRDVMEKRLHKIVLKALKSVKTGEYSTKGMTAEEKELYDELVNVLKSYKGIVDSILSGDYTPNDENTAPGDVRTDTKTAEKVINEEDKNVVLVRVRKAIPRFVAPDGAEYGPYGANEIVKIPMEIANVLRDQGLIELV